MSKPTQPIQLALRFSASRADNFGVKAILTVVVYVGLVLALAVVSLFTRRPEANDGLDDDL